MITTPEQMREAAIAAVENERTKAQTMFSHLDHYDLYFDGIDDALIRIRAIPIAPQPSENRLFDPDSHWGDFIRSAVAEAEKAMRKYPQPNYVITKVAEEAGEVVKAAVHAAEGRETLDNVRGEMLQLVAMLFRLWMEGDQVHGLPPVSGVMAVSANTAAPQPVAVTVKPLVWGKQQSHAGDSYWRSDFGHEILATATDTFAEMETGKRFNFSSDAIKFVQTTHEASILSALTIHPADPLSDPRVVALVEAGEWWGDLPRPDYLHTDLCWKAFNGSLDAAKALHDAVLPDLLWDIWCGTDMNGRRYYGCNIATVDTAYHTDPARAWLIAILRALIAQATP